MGSISKSMKLLVICGPSGSGKSTLIRRLFDEFPNKFGFSVSHTTRQPRPGEKDGVHYYFSSAEEIQKRIADGEFLESATFSNNIYGTSLKSIQDVCELGKICVLDIDSEGVRQVKQKKELDPIYIFIKPPSIDVLASRLKNRGTESEESLNRRLSVAGKEMDYGQGDGNFHAVVVNDDIQIAFADFKSIIIEEFLKRGIDVRQSGSCAEQTIN